MERTTSASMLGRCGATLALLYFASHECASAQIMMVSTVAGGNGSTAQGSANGIGTAATFYHPIGVAVDPTGGNLYVADWGNNLIR